VERGLPRTSDGLGGENCDNGGGSRSVEVGGVPQKLDDGGRVSVTRRVAFTAVKVVAVAIALTVTCAFVWYTMGLPFLLQVVVVAFIAFVASGGYRFIYLVYRTAPRDLR